MKSSTPTLQKIKTPDPPQTVSRSRVVQGQKVKIFLVGKRSEQTLEILISAAFAQMEKLMANQSMKASQETRSRVNAWCPLAGSVNQVTSQAEMLEHLAKFFEHLGGIAGLVKTGDFSRIFGGRSARLWLELLPLPLSILKFLKKGKCAWVLIREMADEAQNTAWMLAAQNCHALVKIGTKLRQIESGIVFKREDNQVSQIDDFTLRKIPI